MNLAKNAKQLILASSLSSQFALSLPLVGGKIIKQTEHPAVVQILSGAKTCVGSFISSTVLLTSEHCINTPKITLKSDPEKSSTKIIVNKKLDLAVVHFASRHPFIALTNTAPKQDSIAYLVGFNEISEKQLGWVRIARIDRRQIISFRGEVKNLNDDDESSSLSLLELGSPMIQNDKLLGIAVDGDEDYSSHRDLSDPDVARFIVRSSQ